MPSYLLESMKRILNQYNFVDYDEQNENFSNFVHYNERINAALHSKTVMHFQKRSTILSKRCNPKGLHLFLFHLIKLPNKQF